jgi:hypothetical protein
MKIFAPCFYPDAAKADLLCRSAAFNRLHVTLYGIGKQFIPHGADAQVYQLMLEMENDASAHSITLVTDCADVLILAEEGDILEAYRSYNSPIVMSAEQGCWPDPAIAGEFPEHYAGYRWPNAGQFIGETPAVLAALKHLLINYRFQYGGLDNSQGWWSLAMIRKELPVVLDQECRIFQSMSGGADNHVEVAGHRIYNTKTRTNPCSIHFNGRCSNDEPYRQMYRRLFDAEA